MIRRESKATSDLISETSGASRVPRVIETVFAVGCGGGGGGSYRAARERRRLLPYLADTANRVRMTASGAFDSTCVCVYWLFIPNNSNKIA